MGRYSLRLQRRKLLKTDRPRPGTGKKRDTSQKGFPDIQIETLRGGKPTRFPQRGLFRIHPSEAFRFVAFPQVGRKGGRQKTPL